MKLLRMKYFLEYDEKKYGSLRRNLMRYDEQWIANRKRHRPQMKGSKHSVDPSTGYLESTYHRGFTSKKKACFIERFKICKSMIGVAKSVGVDIAAVYDAVALDPKFRDDVHHCLEIPNRPTKLNLALRTEAQKENNAVIDSLYKSLEKYGK